MLTVPTVSVSSELALDRRAVAQWGRFGGTMNIFVLSAMASPVAGAIAGGVAVQAPGIFSLTLGAAVGLMIGAALYFAVIGLCCLLRRFCLAEKLNLLGSLASLMAVLLPAAAPFAAWSLSVLVVSRVIG
ncbi:MAG: hypothetical protein JNN07_24175 [Verrucomicrobiales bacterium]|nr:hypothetical protein [Verrucomicrobiales bacterium]